ncbi:MAG: glycosyltransferase, partial [Candidatus Nanopelagicales bacterium]
MPVVHAVVVAYNRRELLHDALTAISEQSLVPDVVHVIDNASTDGTAEMVREQFPDVRLHQLSSNTGGAGGFAVGLAHALADAAEWVWLMDDDTVPTHDALQHLVAAQQDCPGRRPALVASRVVWTDGKDHPMNTPR